MRLSRHALVMGTVSLVAALGPVAGCGGDDGMGGSASVSGSAVTMASATTSAQSGVGASASTGSTSGSAASGGAGGGAVADPALDGPEAFQLFESTFVVTSTADTVTLRGFAPTADDGPRALVLIVPEAGVATSEYDGYAKRLASFGFVATIVGYPPGAVPNHVKNATAVEASIPFLASADSPVSGQVDVMNTGVVGHGLGGKLAVMVGQADTHVQAILGLDAVDAIPEGCLPQYCPDMSESIHAVHLPSGFLDETLDGATSCAPTDQASATLYLGAPSPSFSATILGAGHRSFLDAPASCGAVCAPCATPDLDQDDALGIARAYAVAFFELHLHHDAGYATYLTGAQAQARYVTPGLLELSSK